MDITIESLKAIGFVDKLDPVFPLIKEFPELSGCEHIPAIALTVIRNCQEFAFITGDGTLIFLNIESMADIIRFREFITGVDYG